jgi:flagellar motor switch protein FliN/FliY
MEETQQEKQAEQKNVTPTSELESKEEKAENEHIVRPIEAVYDVPVTVSAVLGSSKMLVSDLLKLTRGSIVELERRVGDPVDIYVNNRLIAKGEVISVDDKLAITMTDVIKILK